MRQPRQAFSALLMAVLAASTAAISVPTDLLAEERLVTVSGRAMPWDVRANPRLPYGIGNGEPPKAVYGIPFQTNKTIEIEATGLTSSYGAGQPSFGPDGDPALIFNDRQGSTGRFMPSRYVSRSEYPVHLNALVAAFVTADGVVLGKPYAIGKHAVVAVPPGAVALQFGVNDDFFADNSGSLTVTIRYKIPKVIMEEMEHP